MYRYRLHQWIITKITSAHSDRTKQNEGEENSSDYEEVSAIPRSNKNRKVNNAAIAGSNESNPDGCKTRYFTHDDARPGTTVGSGGAVHSRQPDAKSKKNRNDGNKTTHVRGQNKIRPEQSSMNTYQSLLRKDYANVVNGESQCTAMLKSFKTKQLPKTKRSGFSFAQRIQYKTVPLIHKFA